MDTWKPADRTWCWTPQPVGVLAKGYMSVMDLGACCEVLGLVCECGKILAHMEGRARPNGLRLVVQPK